jgi:hypothetical protein
MAAGSARLGCLEPARLVLYQTVYFLAARLGQLPRLALVAATAGRSLHRPPHAPRAAALLSCRGREAGSSLVVGHTDIAGAPPLGRRAGVAALFFRPGSLLGGGGGVRRQRWPAALAAPARAPLA